MKPECGAAIALALFLLSTAASVSAQNADLGSRTRFIEEGDRIVVLSGAAEVLDLERCVELALRQNPALAEQSEVLRELEARKITARSEGFPRFDLAGNWTRGRDPSFAFDESFGGSGDGPNLFELLLDPLYDQHPEVPRPDFGQIGFIPDPEAIPAQTFWRTYLDVYWELRPTRVYYAVKGASKAIDQQTYSLTDAQNRTVEAVLQGYHEVVLARERLTAIEAEIEARREFLDVTRQRFLLDLAAPLDTLQAAVSLENLIPERRRRDNALRRAGQNLNLLLGRDPLTSIEIVATFPVESESIPIEKALQLASNRPDLRGQRLQGDLFETQRKIYRADMHPYVTFDGSYGFVTRQLDELTDSGHDYWRASVTLSLPLWDGQLTKGRVREAEANIRRVEHVVEGYEQDVRNEVLSAIDALEVARINLSAAELNMRSATTVFDQVQLRYELGKADNLQVLNAQSDRFVARTQLIEARYNVLALTATLKRALGVSPLIPLDVVLSMPVDGEE